MASKVTRSIEEERVEVDGAEEAGGVTVLVCGRFDRSWASLHIMVTASMEHIAEKCVDSG